jgi:hypothetical protein
MKRYLSLVATLLATLTLCCPGIAFGQSGELTSAEADAVEHLLLLSAQKKQLYDGSSENWEKPTFFADLMVDEQHHVEILENIALDYEISIDDGWWGCFGIFWEVEELDFWCNPFSDHSWWDELDSFVTATALIEEYSIQKLLQSLQETDEQVLIDAYTEMLGVTYDHLLQFAMYLHENPFDYEAQLLDQADVNLALIEAAAGDFEINSGLNDAWYEPATDGQGFMIAVHPEKGTVFLGWFTFDMNFPSQDVIAGLGDACQRWLTAHGPYDGNQADLVVYNSSGGLFNSALVVPQQEPIGSITLQFENCQAGKVSYDLPSYGLMGEIPIQRVASDNIAACQVQSYLNR